MKLLDIIKTVAQKTVENQVSVKLMYAVVTATNPIKVMVDQRLVIAENMLIFPRSCEQKKIQIEGHELYINKKLQTGDKIILLKIGDDFLVIDKVGSCDGEHIVT